MNKEITIYELLGLIKDGKAPKRIIETQSDRWKEEYILDIDGWYMTVDGTTKMNIYEPDRLNDKVEIIEEDNKIKKIQTIGSKWYSEYIEGYFDGEEKYSAYDEYLMNKINELIDELNKLKEDK